MACNKSLVKQFLSLSLSLCFVVLVGFEKPSVPQSLAVVPMCTGRDILLQAASGTGKSGAFLVGTLQLIDETKNTCQALLLSPTRELALQSLTIARALGEHLNIHCHALVGGKSIRDDIHVLRDGVHLVSGTPGRVYDMLNRRHLDATKLKLIVLDEADELLSRGFNDQVNDIFQFMPQDIQVGLFSATMPPEVMQITTKFMRNPTRILVPKEDLTLDGKVTEQHVRVWHARLIS